MHRCRQRPSRLRRGRIQFTRKGITLGGSPKTVGGAGAGNTIEYNGGRGVQVLSGIQHVLSANRIYKNDGIGIDLGTDGVTPNEALGDADAGPNGLTNFPTMASAILSAGHPLVLAIQGNLKSAASRNFTLEFFWNDVCDPSDNGEGHVYLGKTTVNTGILKTGVDFTVQFNPTGSTGHYVTATATSVEEGTSEFSACRLVTGSPIVGTPEGGPMAFSLHSPAPNPFRESTRLSYSLPRAGMVSLSVFDLGGRVVSRVVNAHKEAGSHSADWAAKGLARGGVSL